MKIFSPEKTQKQQTLVVRDPVIPFPNRFYFRWSFLYVVNIFENDFYASVQRAGNGCIIYAWFLGAFQLVAP